MKSQEKPKSILNIFFQGGTRASIGCKMEPAILKNYLFMTRTDPSVECVTLETTNQDETVESEEVVISMSSVIFYSIQKPRELSTSNIVTVPEGTLSRIHQ